MRGFECIEVYGDTIQHLQSSHVIIMHLPAVEGCPLSGVPLYNIMLVHYEQDVIIINLFRQLCSLRKISHFRTKKVDNEYIDS